MKLAANSKTLTNHSDPPRIVRGLSVNAANTFPTMTPSYDTLRRLVVGTDVNGRQVTMRCFIDEDGGTIESKFYIGRFYTPYGQEILHRLHESLQPSDETVEEQAKAMRRAWFKKFKFVGQDVQAELNYCGETKRILLAHTTHNEDIWTSWVLKTTDGELKAQTIHWKSPTSTSITHIINNIEDVIDLHTLVPEIAVRGSNDWKYAALNLLALRFNLEEPPEYEARPEEFAKKRSASCIPGTQNGTSKKPRMKEERIGEGIQSTPQPIFGPGVKI